MILALGFALSVINNTISEQKKDPAKKLTITPVVEIRDRFERRTGTSFDNSINSNRSDLYNRERLGFAYKYGDDLKGQFVYQYSSDPYTTEQRNWETDNADLVLGYASKKIGDGWLTGGIQRLAIGNERLLGECCEWNNYGISWDALRFKDDKFDAFVGRLAVAPKESKDARLTGFDYDSALGKSLVYFNHDREVVGSVAESYDVYTADQDYKHTFKNLTVEAEGAAQVGKLGASDVQSWAAIGRITNRFDKKFSMYLDGEMQSGGKEGNKTMDFTSPYGQNHIYNGSMDIQGGSNKRSLALEGNYAFSPTVKTELVYTRIGLFDDRDAWYGKYFTVNKIGSVSLVNPTGHKGGDVGQELDLSTKWRFRKDTELNIGVSEFLPGDFIKAFVPTGKVDNQIWFYTQVTYKFAG